MAHLMVGRYLFEVPRDYLAAESHFQRVIELEGPRGDWYDEGLYMLGWNQYNCASTAHPDSYLQAMETMHELLSWYQEIGSTRKGSTALMVDEAIKYTAISLMELSFDGGDPLQLAQQFFANTGRPAHEGDVYRTLAELLRQDPDRQDQAIEIYRYTLEQWPLHSSNPDMQWQVIQILSQKEAIAQYYGGDSTAIRA